METVNDMLMLYAAITDGSNDMSLMFKDAQLPAGIDYKDLAGTIIVLVGTCPVVVSETKQFKYISDLFFRTHYDMFNRIIRAMETDYKPLENYDRIEEGNDRNWGDRKNNGTVSNKGGGETNDKHTGTDTHTNDHTGTDTVTHRVSAFNDTGFVNDNQDETTYDSKDTITDSYDSNMQSKQELSNTRTDDLVQSDDFTTKHYLRARGNIGTLTSQAMLQSEIDLRLRNDIYKIIAKHWADECALSVW